MQFWIMTNFSLKCCINFYFSFFWRFLAVLCVFRICRSLTNSPGIFLMEFASLNSFEHFNDRNWWEIAKLNRFCSISFGRQKLESAGKQSICYLKGWNLLPIISDFYNQLISFGLYLELYAGFLNGLQIAFHLLFCMDF